MFGMHPTLLVGPADWDPARLPKDDFLGRVAKFWAAADAGLAGVIVYGSPRDHAELAYLTHFTPKLEPAIALIPREGAPRLLVGGGVNMLGAAKPLTFVETLLPLRDAGQAILRWRDELGSSGLVLVNGDAMPFAMRQEIERALGAPPPDVTPLVRDAMRRKSSRELALIRDACASLDAAFLAMREAQRAGKGMTDMVLAGEEAAWRRGAQDVRSLCSRDGLAPFAELDHTPADPVQMYLAARHDGYWAEGFAVVARTEPALAIAARAALEHALPLARPGTPHRALVERLAQAVGDRQHPVTHNDFGGTIGLALDEPGCLTPTSDRSFASGEVVSIRVGLREQNEGAIVSAMIAITDSGHEVLWPGARP